MSNTCIYLFKNVAINVLLSDEKESDNEIIINKTDQIIDEYQPVGMIISKSKSIIIISFAYTQTENMER